MDIDTQHHAGSTNITLGQLDRVVQTPKTIQGFLEQRPDLGVNQVFNVTPHSVEGMDWTSSLLQRACSKHHVESVRWLLEHGADPNLFRDAVEDINSIPPITLCVLHAVSVPKRTWALENMRALVAHGARVNRETECSSYPIECAAAVVTERSPEGAWRLPLFLVEQGALTKHLTPNLFSAPPAKLVERLQTAELERQATMRALLTFTLQCTEIVRNSQQNNKATPDRDFAKPVVAANSPFTTRVHTKSPRTPTMGPLSQLGLAPPCTPPAAATPRARTITPDTQSYTTPTTNLSRVRTCAQLPPPRAPFSKLKASGVKRSNSRRSSSAMDIDPPQVSQTLEFATPTRSVLKRARPDTSDDCETPLKRRRVSARAEAQASKLGSKIYVPTDVQRVILEFAMPVLHAETRKQRINTLLRMKAQRASNAHVSTWFRVSKP